MSGIALFSALAAIGVLIASIALAIPGRTHEPDELESVVGRRLTRRLAPDERVELDDLEPAEEPVAAHAAPRP